MTIFFFNFFHSVDNEIIVEVSSSIGRKLYIRTWVGWNSKRNPVETPNEILHFHVLEGPQIWMTIYYFFFQSLDNEIIVSFKFFRPKITHSFVLGWNFNRNPVETLKEMSHFHLLEGQQIWMTFYFYLFRGVDNEIIVSFKFFRLKVLHSYLVEISNETSLKLQMKCCNFMFLIGRKVKWLFFFNFFHSIDNEVIVSFKFFRPKIIHSYILGWNLKRNPVETPNEISHFHVLEGPQIWMTIYIYFFS
jgi:hypothetical protein